jgi:hypothetical protein
MAPDGLQVSPTSTADGLVVTWRKVTRNVENHVLPDTTQTNFVYRAPTREALEDLTSLAPWLVTTLAADPQDATTPLVSWTDTDPILVPPFGTTPFFYRIRVADQLGRPTSSRPSAPPTTFTSSGNQTPNPTSPATRSFAGCATAG